MSAFRGSEHALKFKLAQLEEEHEAVVAKVEALRTELAAEEAEMAAEELAADKRRREERDRDPSRIQPAGAFFLGACISVVGISGAVLASSDSPSINADAQLEVVALTDRSFQVGQVCELAAYRDDGQCRAEVTCGRATLFRHWGRCTSEGDFAFWPVYQARGPMFAALWRERRARLYTDNGYVDFEMASER